MYRCYPQFLKCTQLGIDIPGRYLWKINILSRTSEGDNQGGIPRETPTGEPRKSPIKQPYQVNRSISHAKIYRVLIEDSY